MSWCPNEIVDTDALPMLHEDDLSDSGASLAFPIWRRAMALEKTQSTARIVGQAVAGRRWNTKPETPSAQPPGIVSGPSSYW